MLNLLPEWCARTCKSAHQRTAITQIGIVLHAPLTLTRAIGVEDDMSATAVTDIHGTLKDLPSTNGRGVKVVLSHELRRDTWGVAVVD